MRRSVFTDCDMVTLTTVRKTNFVESRMNKDFRRTIALLLLCLISPAFAAPVLWIGDSGQGIGTNSLLGRVDVASGAVQVVGDMGFLSFDIAFDPNGQLFGIGEGKLWSIDPATASSTAIGDTVGATSLVFASDGTLYAATDRLYTIDPATGQETEVGNGGAAYSSSGDLAFIAGELYLTSTNLTGFPPLIDEDLIHLDTATGAGTFVGTLGSFNQTTQTQAGFVSVFGLATDNGVDLYGVSGTRIIDIDTSDGSTTFIRDYSGSGLGFANGSAFFSESGAVVPVPAALPLFLTALAVAGWAGRRRLGS